MKDLDLREFASEHSSKESIIVSQQRQCLWHTIQTVISLCFFSVNAVYNLYAVSNHSGTTMGGHYTAYCRNPNSGEWYTFNDSRWVQTAAH